jgi:imidazole glycerol-phosphate synthase subunit HisH
MKVVIIDYGVSNLSSIKQSVEFCGGDPLVTANPDNLSDATHVILPGVGSFKDGMENLTSNGWVEPIRKIATKDRIPFLGICLGMQFLCDEGFEHGKSKGLGLVPGEVKKLEPIAPDEKIPHVGWNEVDIVQNHNIFDGIPSGNDFYFVHSFHFVPKKNENILSTTPYCNSFVSSVNKDNVFGTQFHPEKSQRLGLQFITNFLNL